VWLHFTVTHVSQNDDTLSENDTLSSGNAGDKTGDASCWLFGISGFRDFGKIRLHGSRTDDVYVNRIVAPYEPLRASAINGSKRNGSHLFTVFPLPGDDEGAWLRVYLQREDSNRSIESLDRVALEARFAVEAGRISNLVRISFESRSNLVRISFESRCPVLSVASAKLSLFPRKRWCKRRETECSHACSAHVHLSPVILTCPKQGKEAAGLKQTKTPLYVRRDVNTDASLNSRAVPRARFCIPVRVRRHLCGTPLAMLTILEMLVTW